MSFKTIVAILITIFITVVMLQNTDPAEFTILFVPVSIPKVAMLTAVSVSAFLLGVLAARPRKKREPVYDDGYDDNDEEDEQPRRRPDTLSDEDRDYIS